MDIVLGLCFLIVEAVWPLVVVVIGTLVVTSIVYSIFDPL